VAAVVSAEEKLSKKHEKRGLAGLGYGLGGVELGQGIGIGHGLGIGAVAAAPVATVAHGQPIGPAVISSIHTTITKQVRPSIIHNLTSKDRTSQLLRMSPCLLIQWIGFRCLLVSPTLSPYL